VTESPIRELRVESFPNSFLFSTYSFNGVKCALKLRRGGLISVEYFNPETLLLVAPIHEETRTTGEPPSARSHNGPDAW
jgi:hypothetical protein